jgi:hypothetical protein
MKDIPARDVTAAIRRAMGAAGIEHVAHRLVGNLSKGYRQRVGIAQAILGDPVSSILDEPTSGLDPSRSPRSGPHPEPRRASTVIPRATSSRGRADLQPGHHPREDASSPSTSRGASRSACAPPAFAARVSGPVSLLCDALNRVPRDRLEVDDAPPAADGTRRVVVRVEHGPTSAARSHGSSSSTVAAWRSWARGDDLEEIFLRLVGEESRRARVERSRGDPAELASYFGSWTAYVLLAVYLVLGLLLLQRPRVLRHLRRPEPRHRSLAFRLHRLPPGDPARPAP